MAVNAANIPGAREAGAVRALNKRRWRLEDNEIRTLFTGLLALLIWVGIILLAWQSKPIPTVLGAAGGAVTTFYFVETIILPRVKEFGERQGRKDEGKE